jgi:hypothetical protein
MTQQSTRLFPGACILVVGLAISVYAGTTLHLGSIVKPGPGGFPFVLGVLLTLTGALSLTSAFFRRRDPAPPDILSPLHLDYRVLGFVLISIAVFALLIENFGLFPACFAIVMLASGVVRDMSLAQRAVSAVLAAVLAVVLFQMVLNVPVHIFAWPFGAR